MADTIRYTSCSFHCLNTCVLKVRVNNGVITAIEPDDTINPGVTRDDEYLPAETINRGMVQRRPCAKGYAWRQLIYDPQRLKYPLKRTGRRGEAKFQRISWDEAIDTIAQKLVETKANYGPYSVMYHPYSFWGNCNFPLAPWFGAGVATWQCHSTGGWEQPALWVLGKDKAAGVKRGVIAELAQDELNIFKSKLIVLWGMNPLTTWSGGVANSFLRAKKAGIPIICIDSRYTASAEVLADQWLPIRPGTDVAMVIGMANVLFKEDLCDREFIAKYVEPEGLRRWQDYVQGKSDGIDKTPGWAESICGVPAETIAEFARLYARSKPVNLNASLALGRQFYGENNARALMYLQALTGNTCIEGGTAAADTGIYMGIRRKTPAVDWGRQPGEYTAPTLMAAHKWAKAIDLREALDKGKISAEAYNDLIGNAPGNPCPNIRTLIEAGNNHAVTLPDMNATISALKKLDFVLVWSQYAESAMARYADILLPNIYTAFEGRNDDPFCKVWTSGANLPNIIIYRQKCVDAPGEVRPLDWVWTQVAKKLGIIEKYNPRMADVSAEDWDEAAEALHREAYERWAASAGIAPLRPPDWAKFQEKPVFRWELPDAPHYPFKEEMESGENPFRGTASGRIEFYSGDPPVSRSARGRGPGNLPPMAQMSTGGRDNFYSSDSAKYPLLMSSPHAYYRVHSWLDNSTLLREDCYRHAVWLNVADAKARGIKDDDPVRVYNDIGEVVLPAYVTSRIVPGTAAIHHGGWYQPGKKNALMPDGIDMRGSPNFLIHNEDLPDTIVGFCPCKGLVQVERLGQA